MNPLLSAQYLAHRLGTPLSELRNLAREVDAHYRRWEETNEKTGKVRRYTVPVGPLKAIQRRILRRILNEYALPDVAHGGVKGRSPMTNTEQHCGKPLVVTQDVRDFFPSVSHRQVASMFAREFGAGRDVVWLLTRLTTIDGQLPQGAPTSTAIANIVLASKVDQAAEAKAREHNVTVTRFVDDFAYSGANARSLINSTARASSTVGLRTWRSKRKLRIMPASNRQEVTGLTVNAATGPSVPREKRDRVRAAIHQLGRCPAESEQKAIQSIRGRLNHVERYNAGSGARLARLLEKTLKERTGAHERAVC